MLNIINLFLFVRTGLSLKGAVQGTDLRMWRLGRLEGNWSQSLAFCPFYWRALRTALNKTIEQGILAKSVNCSVKDLTLKKPVNGIGSETQEKLGPDPFHNKISDSNQKQTFLLSLPKFSMTTVNKPDPYTTHWITRPEPTKIFSDAQGSRKKSHFLVALPLRSSIPPSRLVANFF